MYNGYDNQKKLERIIYEHISLNEILRFSKKDCFIKKTIKEYFLNNTDKFV